MEGSVKKRWVGRGIETSERGSERKRLGEEWSGKKEDRGASMSRSISRPLGSNVDRPALPHVGRKRTALRAFQAQ